MVQALGDKRRRVVAYELLLRRLIDRSAVERGVFVGDKTDSRGANVSLDEEDCCRSR